MKTNTKKTWSMTGFIVAMGVVYGDIGTSPLYAMKAIVDGQGGIERVSESFILGAVSLIIWTLTIQTTLKYVLIALNADNHGEGGIFSLYTLVRKMSRWLILPAMIGGAALLADGALTPAVTVTTAVEGLRGVPQFVKVFGEGQDIIVIITLSIIAFLFAIQRFGTYKVGKLFGPVMFFWFTFIGLVGLFNLTRDLSILRAFNPVYALQLLTSPNNQAGIFILGSVFLVTTGAEALYSDLGHVGKGNIHASWPYVKITLILCYLGQAAWILEMKNSNIATPGMLNPFFEMIPTPLNAFSVAIATLAAIIASQSLISGSYTLVSEAIHLKLLPRLKILYPGQSRGQMYVPAVNLLLWFATSSVVLLFRSSHNMEAAYGLAITVTMLMTTMLLFYYLMQTNMKKIFVVMIIGFFGIIETMFFISSATKFLHGGYFAVLMALMILFVMFIWEKGNEIKQRYVQPLDLNKYKSQIQELRNDKTIDLYQFNVAFLTTSMDGDTVERPILYSILDKHPKRAKVYWFIQVIVTDEPYTREYEVDMMDTDYMVKVKLYLGFRMRQDVSRYMRTVVCDLMESGRLPKQKQHYTVSTE
ncbi:MAG: KUP/HAK/KT family potassium transporter, partial [Streptococcaceae bacterium]|nr:KUP/HAK/KT family potassium transporter [Streptococcaceae bacterium]